MRPYKYIRLKQYPSNIKFKYNWRQYQKRVLDDLEEHLDDNHLHIIAPPGSGKTVLGLEVAIRLNKPTLIFAPTIAIRNQWIQRFCELFLQVANEPDWISRDIKNPKFLTVVTYQSLHAACTNSKEVIESEETEEEAPNREKRKKTINTKDLVKALEEQGIGTIVVDEAHHLKNEWWRSLNAVKNAIKPTTVGLTATPPYDVSFAEWQRYTELNGPVDLEISVPELVVENDLCPHQDYVLLSTPTEEESRSIRDQREKAQKVFEQIKHDETIKDAIKNHPIYQSPLENLNWIYNNLEYYSSILIYLNAVGEVIEKHHLKVIGDKNFKIPDLNFEWIETLLNLYLFVDKDNFSGYEKHRESTIKRLKRNGLLDRKTANFRDNRKIDQSLNNSLSKLQSIDHIVDIEHDTLGDNLRMVILTDYIRKEFLINEPVNNLNINKIGVLPIFEKLRRSNDRDMKLGVLTGSLIIIPKTALAPLIDAAKKVNIENITYSELPFDNQYLIINLNEKLKHDIVQLVTQVFEQGNIEVLIGTKSLLGEGWDAPTINSLILASFVGSYVLSNQMRGRAIRSDRNNPDKVGNIWHLVSVDPSSKDGGSDIQLLKRRFKSFIGVSTESELSIENGINRLGLPKEFYSSHVHSFNNNTIRRAGERDKLKQRWSDALKNGVSLTEEINVPFSEEKDYKKIKSLYYNKTIANTIILLGFNLLWFIEGTLQGLGKAYRFINSPEDLYNVFIAIGVAGSIYFGLQIYKTLSLYIKYRDISKDVQKIGEALLESLIKMDLVKTERHELQVNSSIDNHGAVSCHIEGGTTYERSIFIKSLHETISTIDNPRYLILRKSLLFKLISQKDYHSVPELIGRNKKTSEYFELQWRKLVGSCNLIYTRSIEGRKVLLQSRIRSLASQFEPKSKIINRWK